MKIFGLAGWSGSGKTSLLIRLLPEFIRSGLTISTIKHAHHHFDVDQPGKDSWAHRQAGASEVMISSANRWALMHEHRDGAGEAPLQELISRLSPVDLVLVEGFKGEPHYKLEVHRQELGKPPLYVDDPFIVAIASDVRFAAVSIPQLDLNDTQSIFRFILLHCELEERAA